MTVLPATVALCDTRVCSDWPQVKVAEHVLTGHKVAIKILNRKKIKQMDMEEKGGC